MISAGGERVAGWIGSYCYDDACVDFGTAPRKRDLPRLSAAAGGSLTFTLSDDVSFFAWSASYSEGTVIQGPINLGGGGSEYDFDAGTTPPPELFDAIFDTPPAGDWVLAVYVRYSEGGDATYHWRVTVH